MCDSMRTLQRNEEEQKAKCYGEADADLRVLYGQYLLDSRRMQRFHGDRCEECLQRENSVFGHAPVRTSQLLSKHGSAKSERWSMLLCSFQPRRGVPQVCLKGAPKML
jgi:hypothetical protein